jgi:hypothetical protein
MLVDAGEQPGAGLVEVDGVLGEVFARGGGETLGRSTRRVTDDTLRATNLEYSGRSPVKL